MVDPIPEGWESTYTRAEKALAEPFRGVTTNGQVVPGLFSLQQTGISTKRIKDAADAFIASLTAAQQKVAPHPIDSQEWRKWTNWEQYPLRRGVSLDGSGFSIDGDGRTRLACAAPPLSLTLTGEYTGLSQPDEEDSMRAQHYF